jgi:uncharacterized protein YecE (DUF72 family)
MRVNIGTAGWSIPRDAARQFPQEGTSLQRYAARLRVAEINSSFHRPHRTSTWERWRDSVPNEFRFSVKLPKLVTHQLKLVGTSDALGDFVRQVELLGDKLAVLLVQLPPKLVFEGAVDRAFFRDLAARTDAAIACEPRHATWFDADADALLEELGVARVAADPAICDEAATPGGSPGLRYWRLHGSPVIYRSSYRDRIEDYAARLERDAAGCGTVWCIFDNTASSAGAGDALALVEAMERRACAGPILGAEAARAG